MEDPQDYEDRLRMELEDLETLELQQYLEKEEQSRKSVVQDNLKGADIGKLPQSGEFVDFSLKDDTVYRKDKVDFSLQVSRQQLYYNNDAKSYFPKGMIVKMTDKESATHARMTGGLIRFNLRSKDGLTCYDEEALNLWIGMTLNGGFPGFALSEYPAPSEEYTNVWFEFDVQKPKKIPLGNVICAQIVMFLVPLLDIYMKSYQILVLRNGKGMHFHASIKMNKSERLSFYKTHSSKFDELFPDAKWDSPPHGLRPMGCWKTCKPEHPLAARQEGETKWTAPLCYLPAWYGNNNYDLNVEAMKLFQRLFTSFGQLTQRGYFQTPLCSDMMLDGYEFELLREIFLLSSIRTSWKERKIPFLVPLPIVVEAADSKKIYNWKAVDKCTHEGKEIAKFLEKKYFSKNQHGWPKSCHLISRSQEGNYIISIDEKNRHFCIGKGAPHEDQQIHFTLKLWRRDWELRQVCWSKTGKCATLFKEIPLAKWKDTDIKVAPEEPEIAAREHAVVVPAQLALPQVEQSLLPGPVSPRYDESEDEEDIEEGKDGQDKKKTKNKKRNVRRSTQTAVSIFKDFTTLQSKIRIDEYDQGTREDIYSAFKTFGGGHNIPFFEQTLEVTDIKKDAVMDEYKSAPPWAANVYKGRGGKNRFRALMKRIHPAWNPKPDIDDVAFVRLIMATVPKEELDRLKIINQQGHMYFFNNKTALWEYRQDNKRIHGAFWNVVRKWVQRREVFFCDKRAREKWEHYTNLRSTLGTRTWDAFLDEMEIDDADVFFRSLDSAEWQIPLKGKKVFDCTTGKLRDRTSADFFRFEVNFKLVIPDTKKAIWDDIMDAKAAPKSDAEILETVESLKKLFPDAMELFLSPFQNPLNAYDLLRAFGSCFSRKNMKHAYFIYGPTAATKTTIKTAWSHLFTRLFGTSKPAAWQTEQFAQANAHTAQLCGWEGKMLIVTDEIPPHMSLAIDKFKNYLSQRAYVRVRAPHAKEEHDMAINFQFFFIFNGGDVPRFDANAAELTRRMAVFEANRSYFHETDSKHRVPPNFDEKDPYAYNRKPVNERIIDGVEMIWASPEKQKTQAGWAGERPPTEEKLNQLGTLGALMAAIVCRETAHGTLNIPWTKATLDARDKMVFFNDTVGKFLQEFYERDEKDCTRLKDLWDHFQQWREGVRGSIMVYDTFKQALVNKRLVVENMVKMKLKEKKSEVWESDSMEPQSLKRKETGEHKNKNIKLSDLGNCSLIPEILDDGTANCPKCWEVLKKHRVGLYCDSDECMLKWPLSVLTKKKKKINK